MSSGASEVVERPRSRPAVALLLSVAVLAPLLATADALVALVGGALQERELELLGAGAAWGLRAYAIALSALVSALLALVLLELAVLGAARLLERRGRPPARALALAITALCAPLAFLLGHYLLSGGAMQRALPHPAWRVALGALLTGALFACARLWLTRVEPLARSWRARGPLLAAGLGLIALDQLCLPGLYPPCHGLLLLGAVLVAQRLLWERLAALPLRSRPRRAALLAGLAAAAVVPPLALPWESRPFESFLVGRFTVFSSKALALVGAARQTLRPPAPAPASEVADGPREQALRRLLGARDRWPDLYLIFVDGLSPFRTSLGGHHRDTTPFLAELARRGLYLPRAYATAPGTIASLRSILSGEHQHEQKPPRAAFVPRLVDRFTALGYRSYCDLPFARETLRGVRCSLQVSIERADWSRDGLLSYLASAREPVLAFVLLSATHYPYQTLAGPRYGPSREDRYDSALAGTDRLLRELHAAVQRLGRDARYVITGDHGHAFGWHGLHGHNSSLYEDQIRVPLVLAGFPQRPRTIATPVSLIDLATTLAGGAGADLAPLLAGSGGRPDTPIVAFHRERRALVAGEHKLIVDAALGSAELYDLAAGPREERNLVAAEPELAARLRARLDGLRPFR